MFYTRRFAQDPMQSDRRIFFFSSLPSLSLLLLVISPAYTLTLHFRDTTNLSLPSSYTTIGSRPSSSLLFPVIPFNTSHCLESCNFHPTFNLTQAQGSFFLFTSHTLPPLSGCNKGEFGSATALARMVQAVGGKGLIIGQTEQFWNGRFLGFDPCIKIPLVVMNHHSMRYFKENHEEIVRVELLPISPYEDKLLQRADRVFLVWRIFVLFLYSVALLALFYLIGGDFVKFYKEHKKICWHGFSMKIASLFVSLGTVIFVSVDPFGFRGVPLPSRFVMPFELGIFAIVYILLLQVWMDATNNIKQVKLFCPSFAHVIHFVSVLVVVLSTLRGTLWHISSICTLFCIFYIVIVCICGVGFIIFGKNMVSILSHSENTGRHKNRLSVRIVLFVVLYNATMFASLTIYGLEILGHAGGSMFLILYQSIMILTTMSILFTPSWHKAKKKHSISFSPKHEHEMSLKGCDAIAA
eukprot:Phypoly_transcript_07314.p1 GENE.Phypoly_transcript_07314~~Phypoly_transcript_07314.p1  ORF type:complete len:467 (+),score=42.08 Phypoly_transcript_07314:142-1542(+)